jgi:hypothetical protein
MGEALLTGVNLNTEYTQGRPRCCIVQASVCEIAFVGPALIHAFMGRLCGGMKLNRHSLASRSPDEDESCLISFCLVGKIGNGIMGTMCGGQPGHSPWCSHHIAAKWSRDTFRGRSWTISCLSTLRCPGLIIFSIARHMTLEGRVISLLVCCSSASLLIC